MRVLFFDQIKALMIALVISVHVFLALLGDWFGVHSAKSGSPHSFPVGVAVCVMSFSNTFYVHAVSALGLSLQDRILRLGLPFVGGMLLINHVLVLLGCLSPASPLATLPWRDMPLNHVMVLWFLRVLFASDLLY